MIGNVKGKVSIVTGGGAGLGRAMAEKLAQFGSNVVIADLNFENANIVAKEIEEKFKIKALAVAMDVTNEGQVKEAVEKTEATFGKIDVLICNAGIQTIAPIVEFEFEKWKRLLDIHINGTFLPTKACMNSMIKTKTKGKILVIGSVHSLEASKNKSAYVTAKHGLRGFVRSIAKEGAEYGISSNLIAPGFVLTDLVAKQIPEQAKTLGITENEVVKKVMLGNTVDGEWTTVDDIANTALFLAGFETNALTGQTLTVSHGWNM